MYSLQLLPFTRQQLQPHLDSLRALGLNEPTVQQVEHQGQPGLIVTGYASSMAVLYALLYPVEVMRNADTSSTH